MPAKKLTGVLIIAVSLLPPNTSALAAGFSRPEGCQEPPIKSALQSLVERNEKVSKSKALNAGILKDRERALSQGKLRTYAATGLALADGAIIGVVTAAYAAEPLIAASQTGMGYISLLGFVGKGWVFSMRAMAVGQLVGTAATAALIPSDAPRVRAQEGVDRTIGALYSNVSPMSLSARLEDRAEQFDNAHRRVGEITGQEVEKLEKQKRLYHLGWDEKHLLEILVAESKAQLRLDDLEAHFIAEDRLALEAACGASSLTSTDRSMPRPEQIMTEAPALMSPVQAPRAK